MKKFIRVEANDVTEDVRQTVMLHCRLSHCKQWHIGSAANAELIAALEEAGIPFNVIDTFDVYLAGLECDDPEIVEEVRTHLQSRLADGNAKLLTILLEAMRSGLEITSRQKVSIMYCGEDRPYCAEFLGVLELPEGLELEAIPKLFQKYLEVVDRDTDDTDFPTWLKIHHGVNEDESIGFVTLWNDQLPDSE